MGLKMTPCHDSIGIRNTINFGSRLPDLIRPFDAEFVMLLSYLPLVQRGKYGSLFKLYQL